MNARSLFKLCIVVMTVVSVSGCKNCPSDTRATTSMPVFPVAGKPSVLATIPLDEKAPSRNMINTATNPGTAVIIRGVSFADNGGGAYYVAEKGGNSFVVHNGKPGSLYKAIGQVILSPDGSRIAYCAVVGEKWRVVVDGKAGELFDEVPTLLFSPDGKHVIYDGKKDDVWHLVIDTAVNKGSRTRYRTPQFSGDSALIIYIDNIDDKTDMGRLVVCDIRFNNERIINSGVTNFVLNNDREYIAAKTRTISGKEKVIQFSFSNINAVVNNAEYDKVDSLSLAPSGKDLFYIGVRQGVKYGVFNSQEEILKEGFTPLNVVINQAANTVGILMENKNLVFLYSMFSTSGKQGKKYDEAEFLTYSSDGAVSSFAAMKGKNWFTVTNGIEGPAFDRVVSPKFSPDGKYLAYRARKNKKRFVVVADASGKVLRQHPPYEQVFDVQFTSDGKSVAYGVKDGHKLIWKVEKL